MACSQVQRPESSWQGVGVVEGEEGLARGPGIWWGARAALVCSERLDLVRSKQYVIMLGTYSV